MPTLRGFGRVVPLLGACLVLLATASSVFAHEERDVHGFTFEVGFISEPVFVGDKSGLEFFVHKGDQAVAGLETVLKAEVIQGSAHRDLPISAREGEDGAYESVFIPTVAGKYTFHLTGTLPDGSSMDESFTSGPTGFNEVQEVAAGQFPVRFPSQAELIAQAKKGADAAGQTTVALALGGLGVLLGIAALGVSLAGRSRSR